MLIYQILRFRIMVRLVTKHIVDSVNVSEINIVVTLLPLLWQKETTDKSPKYEKLMFLYWS